MHESSLAHPQRPSTPADGSPSEPTNDTTRALNAAFLSTRIADMRGPAAELRQLSESPAFAALASAARSLADQQGLSEKAATELLVRTVRRIDQIWSDYVFQEGLDRLSAQVPALQATS